MTWKKTNLRVIVVNDKVAVWSEVETLFQKKITNQ